jgi:hypothetical protein
MSQYIFDSIPEAMSDLVICKLSDCTCTVAGGKEVILLCEKVAKGKKTVMIHSMHIDFIIHHKALPYLLTYHMHTKMYPILGKQKIGKGFHIH